MRTRRTSASLSIAASVATLAALLAAPAVGAETGTLSVPADEVAAVQDAKQTHPYVVVLDDQPLATYDGDVAGLAATRGKNPNSAQVRKYEQFLDRRVEQALRRADVPASVQGQRFRTALNGFTADLTGAQAAALRADASVLTVARDELRQLTTNSTPDFLGLTDPTDGLWAADGVLGEDVVIGVIDSGIRPESGSFADTGDFAELTDWAGVCETGDDSSFDCTDVDASGKLVGARWYLEGFGGTAALADFPEEFLSPLDADGHGTHTASTAGGNADVTTPFGDISGIAPRARVAAYKVCWGYSGAGGCATSDSVAAIDDAVADGVDVINYSISGTQDNFLDPVELAFLFAADAGVVVNASAGNDGPGLGTANHPSPWITTVGAGTESQQFTGSVTLGDGQTFEGAPSILNPGTEQLPLVHSRFAGLAGVSEDDAALCLADTLDPAVVAGTVVLCERGVIARVDKSAEVAAAGGAAMILGNLTENSLNSDAHEVPTTHVDEVATAAILDYIAATDAPTAAQAEAVTVEATDAPQLAAFSSRGPLAAGDILVPDIFAPGVDILAAYSPTIGGRDFDYLSGTSMSSPHMAGLSALLKEARPDLSAAGIRSAFMTTAYQTMLNGDPIPGGPYAYGSGHAAPNLAADPGLVYDAGYDDWLGFICGDLGVPTAGCLLSAGDEPSTAIDPSDLNQPNIAIGELAGSQTVTRTVTNVGDATSTYTVDVTPPPGVDVTVSDESFTVAPGESFTFAVDFATNADATVGSPTFGELAWSDDAGHVVTSQLVVTPVQLAAPDEISASGRDGGGAYPVTFGYNGPFTAQAHGLELAEVDTRWVEDDPANDINVALGTGVGIRLETVTVPEGAVLSRFRLYDEETLGADDLDLYVFGPTGAFVGGSGSPTSAELVDVYFPEAGTYTVVVHGWQTHKQGTSYSLFSWSVQADPADDDGSLSVTAPTEASLGETVPIGVEWTKVKNNRRYLGAVSYADENGLFGLTLINVNS